MPRRVQNTAPYEQQFQNIFDTAVDKTIFVDVTAPATPDEEFEITHGFGFVTDRFLVISKDMAADVYLSGTPPTANSIFLKCSAGDTVLKILVL